MNIVSGSVFAKKELLLTPGTSEYFQICGKARESSLPHILHYPLQYNHVSLSDLSQPKGSFVNFSITYSPISVFNSSRPRHP